MLTEPPPELSTALGTTVSSASTQPFAELPIATERATMVTLFVFHNFEKSRG